MAAQVVVSISGVQGTGKTTIAKALAARLGACVVSRDPLMGVLLKGGLPIAGSEQPPIKDVGSLGYELQSAILAEQLEIGSSVVLECVAPTSIRDLWRGLAESAGAIFIAVETACSDTGLHRRRFDTRATQAVGDWHLRWTNVERTKQWYEPHPAAAYVADSARPVDEHLVAIMRILDERTASTQA